jgi:phosphomannomutase
VSKEKYVAKVLSFVNPTSFKSFKIVINCGNGAAGPTFDAIASELSGVNSKLRFERINHEVDSSFPNGIPNPLLAENHYQNRKKVLETKADLGVAFDGDFDRCFFFDERGEFVPSQYVVGLLAEIFLIREPGATIVHDPRVIWNIQDIISNNNGVPVVSLTGHSFVKRAMRDHCAVYGGEISAHHYFKEFCYCDSGMIPWLLVVELMSNSGKSLSELVSEQRLKYPTSGELNFNIEQVDKTLRKVVAFYEPNCIQKDDFDGISLSFESWRLNIRRSNTESVVRVNIESRGDPDLINRKIEEIRTIMLS